MAESVESKGKTNRILRTGVLASSLGRKKTRKIQNLDA
jgi:hypothetical protein